MPNSYREVKVTPIAGGIVTRVPVELGATVRRGTPLATLSSTDLAEAQTRYLSMAAMLEADQKKLERTRKLAEIGAASRQELEEVTAVHTSRATELEAARQRLLLLGLTRDQAAALVSPTQVVSEIVVPAPIDGVVTARMANLGQVVGMGQELFVVTDLAEVWVVGDLYEQDFGSVAVGAEAVVTAPAYPGLTLRGRVTLHRPAGRCGHADREGPGRGAEPGRATPARDVREPRVHDPDRGADGRRPSRGRPGAGRPPRGVRAREGPGGNVSAADGPARAGARGHVRRGGRASSPARSW